MIKKYFVLFAIGVFFFACNTSNNETEKPTVMVSVVPQKFFVDKIAGAWLKVNVMVPVGASPATYEATPLQMKDLSHSSAYFKIGHLGFEKGWMQKLASLNTSMQIVNTANDSDLIFEEEFGRVHHDDNGHEHTHEGYNPHTWLSPKLVKKQAEIIYQSLCEIYPAYKQEMTQNYNAFMQQVDSTQTELSTYFTKAQGTPFIVYHPVWNYLARDYNLKQVAIEHNGKEASAKKMKQVINFAKTNDIHIIFAQKEFSSAQAESIAHEINGKVVLLNPLDYNWFTTMHEFVSAFNQTKKEN